MLFSGLLTGLSALLKGVIGNKIGSGLKKVASGLFSGASAFGANYLQSRVLNAHLTGAQQEQNAFNASEADKNRAFNAEQAQLNRDFQAEQAATQWQRGVADMRAAGLNPALAYGQGGASAMSGAMASGTPASGSQSNFAPSSLSELMQLSLLEKQGRMMDEEIRGKQLENEGQDIANAIAETYGPKEADARVRQIEQSILESIATCGEKSTASALNNAMADFYKAQKSSEELKQAELTWRKEFIEKYHMPPELAGDLVKAAATLAGAGLMSASRILDFVKGRKGKHTRSITERQADGTTITDTFTGFDDMF